MNTSNNIPFGKRMACHAIIHVSSLAASAVGAGLAQIPCSDSAVIAPIQTAMTFALSRVFDRPIEEAGKGAVLSGGATVVGRGASQVLVGWIPGFGNAVNAGTAGTLTETAGWLAVRDYARAAGY